MEITPPQITYTARLPLVLLCRCSMCIGCVTQEHKRRKTSVVCAKCNKSTPLDNRQVTEQLSPNFFLLGLLTAESRGLIRTPLDVTSKSHSLKTQLDKAIVCDYDGCEAHTPNISCDECSQCATVNCDKCGGIYCDACFNVVHSSSKSMRSHTSTPLSLALATPTVCPSHAGSQHTHFCCTDNTAVCPDCLLEEHKDHHIIKLHEAALSIRERLSPLFDCANATVTRMKETEETLGKKLLSLSELLESTTMNVNICFSFLHTALQSREVKVLRELNHAVSLYGNALLTTKSIIHSHLVTLSSTLMEGQAVLKSDYNVLKKGDELITKLSDVNHLPQSLDQDKVKPISFAIAPVKDVLDSGCVIYDPEYTGPTLLSQEGVPHSKFLDIPSKQLSDLQTSRSVSLVSKSASVSNRRSRSATPVTGQKSSNKELPRTRWSASPSSRSTSVGERNSPAAAPVSLFDPPARPIIPANVNTDGACDVTVTHVESLDKFHIQTLEQQEQLTVVKAELEEHSSGSQALAAEDLYKGLHCAAQFSQDGMWYRAAVRGYLGDDLVDVYYVDYGNSEQVKLSSECTLANVSPLKLRSYGHISWSKEARQIFDTVVRMDSIKLKVYDWNDSGVLSVDILYPVEGGYTSVCAKLVSMGLATRGAKKLNQEAIPSHVTMGYNDTRDVVVPVAENPHDFFIHLDAQTNELDELVEQVQKAVSLGQLLPIGTPRKGMLCLAKYHMDSMWYRAVIIDVTEKGVRVLFVDYGNDQLVSTVYPLCSALRVTPVQAIHCSLYNLVPLEGGDKWSDNVADFFNDYVSERVFTMSVRSVVCEGAWKGFGGAGVIKGGLFKNLLLVEMIEKGREESLCDILVTLKMARCKVPLEKDVSEIVSNILLSKSKKSHKLGPVPIVESSTPPLEEVHMPPKPKTSSQPDTHSPSELHTRKSLQSDLKTFSPKRASSGSKQHKSKPTESSLNGQTYQLASKVIPPPVLPTQGISIPCSVTHITSPNSFSVVFLDKEYADLLKQLAFISHRNHGPPVLRCGDVCLAFFSDSSTWHRAVVTEKPSKTTVLIRYVDYGDSREVKLTDVQPIPYSLCQYPARAVKCTLEGIDTRLTPEASPLFYKLVLSSGLHAQIHGVTDEGVLSVSLTHPEKGNVKEAIFTEEASQSTLSYVIKPIFPQDPFTLQVTFISNDLVYGHVITKENTDLIQKVALDVEEECSRHASQIQCAVQLSINQSCCAQYSEDGSWNRAYVKQIYQDCDKLEVQFIDFGNTELVNASETQACVVHPNVPALAIVVRVVKTEKVEVDERYMVHYLPMTKSFPPHVSLKKV